MYLKQGKTSAYIKVPIIGPLKAALDAERERATSRYILTGARGEKWESWVRVRVLRNQEQSRVHATHLPRPSRHGSHPSGDGWMHGNRDSCGHRTQPRDCQGNPRSPLPGREIGSRGTGDAQTRNAGERRHDDLDTGFSKGAPAPFSMSGGPEKFYTLLAKCLILLARFGRVLQAKSLILLNP